MIVRMLLLMAVLFACESDPYDGAEEGGECSPIASMRCLDNQAQICSAEDIWETVYDCAEYGLECLSGECTEVDGGEVDGG